MKLSTKQKVYASILGLGVTALIVDRVVLLPRESAAQLAEPVEPAVALSTPVVEAARELVSASVLSTNTASMAPPLERGDAKAPIRTSTIAFTGEPPASAGVSSATR